MILGTVHFDLPTRTTLLRERGCDSWNVDTLAWKMCYHTPLGIMGYYGLCYLKTLFFIAWAQLHCHCSCCVFVSFFQTTAWTLILHREHRARNEILFGVKRWLFKSNTRSSEYQWTLSMHRQVEWTPLPQTEYKSVVTLLKTLSEGEWNKPSKSQRDNYFFYYKCFLILYPDLLCPWQKKNIFARTHLVVTFSVS